jgi:hypothetical protein
MESDKKQILNDQKISIKSTGEILEDLNKSKDYKGTSNLIQNKGILKVHMNDYDEWQMYGSSQIDHILWFFEVKRMVIYAQFLEYPDEFDTDY